MKIRVKLSTLKRQLLIFLCLVGMVSNGFAFTSLTPLSSVLEEMSEKYQVFFTYNSLELGKVDVDFTFKEDENLDQAINRLLSPTKYAYDTYGKKYFVVYEKTKVGKKQAKKLKRHLKGISKLEEGGIKLSKVRKNPVNQIQEILSYVQPKMLLAPVSGVIKDKEGNPLIGVNILVKGTSKGAISDLEGKFNIDLAEGEDVLVFSYIGFQDQEVIVAGRSEINIVLEENTELLNEVVVVGYGSQRRSDLTGSIVSINSKDLEDLPNPNIMDQVQGRLPGLTIVNSNAAPGSDPNILIRGINSINASNYPLIILDGIPYVGSISSIAPSDIETISVLKDASATAIYGSRGANGVILINTKRGKTGTAPTISLDSRTSFNRVSNKVDVLDVDKYLQYKADYGGSWPVQPSELANKSAGKVTDWQDLTTQTGVQLDNTLSIQGGGKEMSYFGSFSRLDQEGIVIGSEYTRTSFRFNGDYNITDWLTIGSQLNFSEEDWGDKPALSQNSVILLSPLGTPYNEDGSNTFYPVPEDAFFTNPLDILNNYRKSVRRRVGTNFYAKIDFPFLEGLSYKLNYGRLEQRSNTDSYNPSTTLAGTGGGSASRSFGTNINSVLENVFTYTRNFGVHSLVFTGLYSFQESTNDNSSLSDGSFATDDLTFYAVGSGANNNGVSASFSERKLISQMGRLHYGYGGKYNLTYTVRRDGSSVFGANNKYAVFHSGAIAWTLSKEEFLQDLGWIDFLKLKLSYGTNGNQAISPYQTLTRISRGGGYYFNNSVPTFGPSNLGNVDLRWESTNAFNFAVDFGLFDSKLSGTIERYQTVSKDLLRSKSLNASQGFSSILTNIGEVENKGWEVTLNGLLVTKPNFSWDATIGFFANKNEVTKLDDRETDDVASGLFIGEDINIMYGYQFGGVFDDASQVSESAQPDAQPGDAIIVDVNNDGKIDADDRTFIGRQSPDFTMGITNNLNYKNFQLSFHIYVLEGEQRRNNFVDSRFWSGTGRINYVDIDYWTPSNTSAKYPRPSYISDRIRMIEDRDYIRLKNITLGYNLDQQVLDKIGLSGLRIYLAANNLLTITDWTGRDPETTLTGGELGEYPAAKSIVLGASIRL